MKLEALLLRESRQREAENWVQSDRRISSSVQSDIVVDGEEDFARRRRRGRRCRRCSSRARGRSLSSHRGREAWH
ncbi:hypothetical protein KSP39_PZI005981 [Platanthera zijinensis]|uniref:Uncharacterized protein n=1 Tax=Platanthera zijinensis TaxID=2320716 RepID=A0AAP0GAH4_9ASPA